MAFDIGEFDKGKNLLGYNVETGSPTEQLDWAKKIYESGAAPAYEATWQGNLQGAGNIPNIYRSQYYDAYKTARDTLGRDITANEYGRIAPAFVGQPTRQTGLQLVSTIADEEAKSPEGMRKKAPEYAPDVSTAFQAVLERAPTAAEAEHYGGMLATKELDPYSLGELLKGTQEYQTAQDTAFRGGLSSELGTAEQEAFEKARDPLLARYARAGIQNSPALDFAMTNMLGELTKQRTGFLANLSAQQYGGNKAMARSDYENTLQNYLNTINQGRSQNQAMIDALNQRGWQGQDYVLQRGDYLNALNFQRGGSSYPWGQMAGGILGAGVGAFAGGPMGASVGYGIGSGIGGGFDYFGQNRRY